jgi:hypothetical protein
LSKHYKSGGDVKVDITKKDKKGININEDYQENENSDKESSENAEKEEV